MTDVALTHNPDKQRYEAHIGGELAGIAEYELSETHITFTHTEVFPAFEGEGVAGRLARFALDDVRASESRKVRPRCPYIRKWISKHPEYQSLVG